LASGYITVPYTALDAKPAPFMAAFSSQGPNTVTPEILKVQTLLFIYLRVINRQALHLLIYSFPPILTVCLYLRVFLPAA
jgi:hypothetical protein